MQIFYIKEELVTKEKEFLKADEDLINSLK